LGGELEGAEGEGKKDQSDSEEAGAVLNRRRQNESPDWEMHASPKECEKTGGILAQGRREFNGRKGVVT